MVVSVVLGGWTVKREQKIVAIGALSGILFMIVGVWMLQRSLPMPQDASTIAGRLAYAVSWNAFAALPLFAMIVAVGNARFASDAIDPNIGAESQSMIIDGRVTDNTLQQFALFVAGSLALAANVPPDLVTLIGAAAIVFVIARICFWIGYRIDPLYRAFGFSSVIYLNLGLLVSALYFGLGQMIGRN